MAKQDNVGRCELCGLVVHHLTDGACSQCNDKYSLVTSEHSCNDNYAQRIIIKGDPVLNKKAYREIFNIEVAA